MKRMFTVCLALLLVAITCFAVACDTLSPTSPSDFVNPGDNLGGGGTGEVADPSDATPDEVVDAGNKNVSDVSADVNSDGATEIRESDSEVKITADGSYVLSGNFTAGVSVKKGLTVHLFLNNATISSVDAVALSAGKGSNITLTVVKNTVNSILTTGTATENAIHVKGTLVINGNGTLNVSSIGKNAIKVTNALTVVDATMVANGANHAIACGSLTANNATFTVTAGKDGINADCDFDNSDNKTDYEFTTDEGFVSLVDCSFTANVSGDGIQAETFAYVKNSNIDITASAEFVAYSAENMSVYDLEVDDFRYIKSGSSFKKIASDERVNGTKYAMAQSSKGIKVGEIDYEVETADGGVSEITISNGNYALVVESGNITINSDDDAIHVNGGNVFVNGGCFLLSTLDDGITADKLVRVNGGTIVVSSCYEGIEGAQVEFFGGKIDITAEDDGINAASDDNSQSLHIIIGGGNLTVSADGDGLDSNGSILISGGNVVVHGPASGGNAALDADKGIVVTGGTLYAASTLGMVETPSSNSTQNVVSFAQSGSISAGTVIKLVGENGDVLLEVTVQKTCQSIILSSSALVSGGIYSIYANDAELKNFTVNSVITTVGYSSSRPESGGQGGPGGRR